MFGNAIVLSRDRNAHTVIIRLEVYPYHSRAERCSLLNRRLVHHVRLTSCGLCLPSKLIFLSRLRCPLGALASLEPSGRIREQDHDQTPVMASMDIPCFVFCEKQLISFIQRQSRPMRLLTYLDGLLKKLRSKAEPTSIARSCLTL